LRNTGGGRPEERGGYDAWGRSGGEREE
jgi:hypothetical protein